MGKKIHWEGVGETEVGIIDKELLLKFHRPYDKCPLVGDNRKIRTIGWSPKNDIQDMLKNNISTNKR